MLTKPNELKPYYYNFDSDDCCTSKPERSSGARVGRGQHAGRNAPDLRSYGRRPRARRARGELSGSVVIYSNAVWRCRAPGGRLVELVQVYIL